MITTKMYWYLFIQPHIYEKNIRYPANKSDPYCNTHEKLIQNKVDFLQNLMTYFSFFIFAYKFHYKLIEE